MAGDFHKDLTHHDPEHIWERQRQRAPLVSLWWGLAEGRQGMRVLDVGCGPGHLALEWADRVGATGDVLAVDVNPAFLRVLEARRDPRRHAHVRTLLADAQTAPLPERGFDLVTSPTCCTTPTSPRRSCATCAPREAACSSRSSRPMAPARWARRPSTASRRAGSPRGSTGPDGARRRPWRIRSSTTR